LTQSGHQRLGIAVLHKVAANGKFPGKRAIHEATGLHHASVRLPALAAELVQANVTTADPSPTSGPKLLSKSFSKVARAKQALKSLH
jgi:hypothetical protein